MTKRGIVKFLIVAVTIYLVNLTVVTFLSYDIPECVRLRFIVSDDVVRDELIHWVDYDLDLESLDLSETHVHPKFGSDAASPGETAITESNFDWSLLDITTDGSKWGGPRVRLITPYFPAPESGIGKVLANITEAVAFLQITHIAILVKTKWSETYGVNPEHLVKDYGRVALYCAPRQ